MHAIKLMSLRVTAVLGISWGIVETNFSARQSGEYVSNSAGHLQVALVAVALVLPGEGRNGVQEVSVSLGCPKSGGMPLQSVINSC